MAEDKQTHADARKTQELFETIAPVLFGISAPIQGNVIALLLGTWLAGHKVQPRFKGDEKEALKQERDLRARLMMVTTRAAFAYAAANDQQQEKGPEVLQ